MFKISRRIIKSTDDICLRLFVETQHKLSLIAVQTQIWDKWCAIRTHRNIPITWRYKVFQWRTNMLSRRKVSDSHTSEQNQLVLYVIGTSVKRAFSVKRLFSGNVYRINSTSLALITLWERAVYRVEKWYELTVDTRNLIFLSLFKSSLELLIDLKRFIPEFSYALSQ